VYSRPAFLTLCRGFARTAASSSCAFYEGHAPRSMRQLLLTDWVRHTPADILAENFRGSAAALRGISLRDLYIFQAILPATLCR